MKERESLTNMMRAEIIREREGKKASKRGSLSVCLSRHGGEREAASSLEGEWGTIVSARGQEGSEGMCLLTRHVLSVKCEDNDRKREMQWKDCTSKTHNTREETTKLTQQVANKWVSETWYIVSSITRLGGEGHIYFLSESREWEREREEWSSPSLFCVLYLFTHP